MLSERPRAPYRSLGHEPALDGLRGVAVLTVMLWHYPTEILGHSLHWLQSGHLGVDLFFVLSGFLITALMLNEHQHRGSISLPGFYRRRAFRLLPALVVFPLTAIASFCFSYHPRITRFTMLLLGLALSGFAFWRVIYPGLGGRLGQITALLAGGWFLYVTIHHAMKFLQVRHKFSSRTSKD